MGNFEKIFIGHLVEGNLADYYERISQDLVCRFGLFDLSKFIPPHITLLPPFKAEAEQLSQIRYRLEFFLWKYLPIETEVDGFGCFNERVIYLRVRSRPSIVALTREIRDLYQEFGGLNQTGRLNGTPHISIGRFIKPDQFPLVWQYVSRLPKPQFELRLNNLTIFSKRGAVWGSRCVCRI